MATHLYCDACENEIHNGKFHVTLSIPIHAFETQVGGRIGYVDVETMEPVSGRFIHFDLCLTCANKFWKVAVESLDLKCPEDQMTDGMKRHMEREDDDG